MKLQFRHQPFQADAANVICDVAPLLYHSFLRWYDNGR